MAVVKMKKIAFIDSGIGGIPYLRHAVEHIQTVESIYVADTAFFPYGDKPANELRRRLIRLVDILQRRFNPQAIAIACNTASVVALPELRNQFSFPFIGTVPAIKPAATLTANRHIGIMATSQTTRDPYVDDLVARFAEDIQVTRIPAGQLVKDIECRFFSDRDSGAVAAVANRFQDAGCDTVILGCTHFIHLKDTLERRWRGGIRCVDSREGISRQLQRIILGLGIEDMPILTKREMDCDAQKRVSEFFITSDINADYYRQIANHFCIEFKGVFHV